MCTTLDITTTIFMRIGVFVLLYAVVALFITVDWMERHK